MSLKYNEITGEFENIEDSLPLQLLRSNWRQLLKIGDIIIGKTTLQDLKAYKHEHEFCGVRVVIDGFSYWSRNENGIIDTFYIERQRGERFVGLSFLQIDKSHTQTEWESIFIRNGLKIVNVIGPKLNEKWDSGIMRCIIDAVMSDDNLCFRMELHSSMYDLETSECVKLHFFSLTISTDIAKQLHYLEWLLEDGSRFLTFNEDRTEIISCDKNALDTVVIPYGVKIIRKNAFKDCKFIKNVVFNEGLLRIESAAFWNCNSIKELSLPNSLISIGANAFTNCVNINKVVFGSELAVIETNAFSSSRLLSNIRIPTSVIKLGANVFSCPIEIDPLNQHLKTIDNLVYSNRNELIYIPGFIQETQLKLNEQTNSIGTFCLFGHPMIKSLKLNEGIEVIHDNAFSMSRYLEEIHIPYSVERIGSSILANSSLQRLYIYIVDINRCEFSDLMFFSFDKTNCVLYVPESALSSYESNSLFAGFKSILPIKSQNSQSIHTIRYPGNRYLSHSYERVDENENHFSIGDKVKHRKFGNGIIEKVEGEGLNQKVIVNFDKYGQKYLMVSYAKLVHL